MLPLIANRTQLQSHWQSLDNDAVAIIAVTVATLFVAQATFTWTYSRIPFLFWNHMQNSRRLHHCLLQFAAQVSRAQTLNPVHLMQELKQWSSRHGQLLDARRALDATFNGPFGLLLCAVIGLAVTLILQLFVDKLKFDDVQTQCVRGALVASLLLKLFLQDCAVSASELQCVLGIHRRRGMEEL